ncbi:transposase [uncultured Roseobacter sp.]|uniref:transposase n=1 Tax=uncultured Roseobacter sp. TaxID=114847 RepID=UPI00261BBAE3|nr:transposase [uncultured Roseobacter sp.]
MRATGVPARYEGTGRWCADLQQPVDGVGLLLCHDVPTPGNEATHALSACLRRVFETTGSAMMGHPQVHVIAPRGVPPDGACWIACRAGFFLPVRVLSWLFRRLVLEGWLRLHKTGKPRFFSNLPGFADPDTFAADLAPLRKTDWVFYTFALPAVTQSLALHIDHRSRSPQAPKAARLPPCQICRRSSSRS